MAKFWGDGSGSGNGTTYSRIHGRGVTNSHRIFSNHGHIYGDGSGDGYARSYDNGIIEG